MATSGSHGLSATDIISRAVEDMPAALLDSCFDLLATNLEHAYRASSWGWHPDKKRAEMRDRRMRYLLLYAAQATDARAAADPAAAAASGNRTDTDRVADRRIAAFLSFMVTVEDDRLLTYVYEVQVDSAYRGFGIGGLLMGAVELLAARPSPLGATRAIDAQGFLQEPPPQPADAGHGTGELMLTVFTSNVGARRFYERRGYTKDVISPEARQTRRGVVEYDYIIMSKRTTSGETIEG